MNTNSGDAVRMARRDGTAKSITVSYGVVFLTYKIYCYYWLHYNGGCSLKDIVLAIQLAQ